MIATLYRFTDLQKYIYTCISRNRFLFFFFSPLKHLQRKNSSNLSKKNKCLITEYDFKLCPSGEPNIYPNCDASVWLRSCEKEITEPISGIVKGTIPKWLNGSLLRNGPGSLKVGEMMCNHLFDSSALIHK